MPKLVNAVPRYRKHKASGQAVVTINGRDHYLGRYGTKPSRQLYDRLVGEYLATGRQNRPEEPEELRVVQLVAMYWRHAKLHYRRQDGTRTETIQVLKPALAMLKYLYGDLPVDEFGPIALKRIQHHGIEQGHSRRYINDNIDRIRRVSRWGVSEERVQESTSRRLDSVDGLRKGKSEAKEPPPIEPIDDAIVDDTLPHLPPIVADMVQIQRLTCCRPGEVCVMRSCDIDKSSKTWFYIPMQHKTEHHGKSRAIAIGSKTPIATAFGMASCNQGKRACFFRVTELITVLMEARDERQLLRLRGQLAKRDLPIPDELGHVSANKAGTELLFDIISTAYKRQILIVTTKLLFENWTEVLLSERLTGATLDRLTHH